MNKTDLLSEYIEDFFLLSGNFESHKWKVFRKKLTSYRNTYGSTSQVNDMLILMQMYESEDVYKKLSSIYEE